MSWIFATEGLPAEGFRSKAASLCMGCMNPITFGSCGLRALCLRLPDLVHLLTKFEGTSP